MNAHGDVIALTDANGSVVAKYVYDAWGNILKQDGYFAQANPYRYAGYRYDQETNLYYLTARDYDPSIGRFISIDPESSDQSDPLAQNLYLYTRNNPVMYADPDGNWFIDAMFLVVDVAQFIEAPSVAGAGWILGDLASFSDPTGMASAAAHAGKVSRLFNTYSKMRQLTRGVEGVESHHLLEKRFHEVLKVRKGSMLSVGLTKEQHKVYTDRWADLYPYGTNYKELEPEDLKRAVGRVYKDDEALRDATLRWIDDVKPKE